MESFDKRKRLEDIFKCWFLCIKVAPKASDESYGRTVNFWWLSGEIWREKYTENRIFTLYFMHIPQVLSTAKRRKHNYGKRCWKCMTLWRHISFDDVVFKLVPSANNPLLVISRFDGFKIQEVLIETVSLLGYNCSLNLSDLPKKPYNNIDLVLMWLTLNCAHWRTLSHLCQTSICILLLLLFALLLRTG